MRWRGPCRCGRALILLDEPFAALDATLRASVREDVQAILHAAGTTAILVTHDQDEALSVADLVAVMRDGRIAQVDAPQLLYASPVDVDLGGFIGEANVMAGSSPATGSRRRSGCSRCVAGSTRPRVGR